MKVYLISLGCVRNLVDSEVMIGRLVEAGFKIIQDAGKAEIIIVNTCSFIESAVNESIDTILELAKYKQKGSCRQMIVAGCLPERFRKEIISSLPEVDIFLGTGAFDKIVHAVKGSLNQPCCILPDPDSVGLHNNLKRVSSFAHMAYLKIAEGCNGHCSYCIIPKLRGKQKSRNLKDVVDEARFLISSGIKELILVAQDTTGYGTDLCPPVKFARLLDNISNISDTIWVRILYGHPESIDDAVIKTVAKHHNICSYFDIPIQHASDKILKKMQRDYTFDELRRLFDKIRMIAPEAALRTTAIVGFPGETDNDFYLLMDFIKEYHFEHLGVFIYSDSEDLRSHKLSSHIPENIAKNRYDILMSSQMEISRKNNSRHIGNVFKVLVEDAPEDNLYTGRTFFQAPEVDGITYIKSEKLKPGSFARIRITDALEYDLIGEST